MDKEKLAELSEKITKSYYINYPENVIKGKNVFINYGFTCLANEKVYIGDNVLIGPNVTIATIYHDEIKRRSHILKPVKIGDDTIIYAGCIICPGVTIGKNSIIGAGSVVTNDIPDGVMAAGNPCKIIRKVKTNKIALVAIARLENNYIQEWIDWHLAIGFDHIFIYDNACGDEPKLIIDNPKVTIIPAYNKVHYQNTAYTEAYNNFGLDYNYIAYIDIDEFITLTVDKDIHDFINRFPANAECIRMCWENYGDDGYLERDIKIPVQEFFKTVVNQVAWSKSIVKTNLHNFKMVSSHYGLADNKSLITYDAAIKNITATPDKLKWKTAGYVDKYIKLKHYSTKTLKEFMIQKLSRDDANRDYTRTIDSFFVMNSILKINEKTQEKLDYYNKNKNILIKTNNKLKDK